MFQNFSIPKNKYIAIFIILILVIGFFYYTKKSTKNEKKTKSGSKSKKTKPDPDDPVRKDAEELYNLVHEGMSSGMQSDEFNELSGDLADNQIFIELKQKYNHCKEKGLNPDKHITVEVYQEILRKN